MKPFILLFFLLPIASIAQDNLVFTGVVHVDSTTKKEDLYKRARFWMANVLTDFKELSQLADIEAQQLIASSFIKFESSYAAGSALTRGHISYILLIQCKDGKYKYSATGFKHTGTTVESNPASSFGTITTDKLCPEANLIEGMPTKWNNNLWAEIQSKIQQEMDLLLPSLQKAMSGTTTLNSDW